MIQKIFLVGTVFFILGGPLHALSEVDKFVSTRCGTKCIGESTECKDCYRGAIDLFGQH